MLWCSLLCVCLRDKCRRRGYKCLLNPPQVRAGVVQCWASRHVGLREMGLQNSGLFTCRSSLSFSLIILFRPSPGSLTIVPVAVNYSSFTCHPHTVPTCCSVPAPHRASTHLHTDACSSHNHTKPTHTRMHTPKHTQTHTPTHRRIY